MATTKKNISPRKSDGNTKATPKTPVTVKSGHVKETDLTYDTSHNTSQTKVFESWLSEIIPNLDKERGRIDDDDTMMKIVQIARKGIAQNQYSALKKELQFSIEDWMHILDASESTFRRLDKKDFLD